MRESCRTRVEMHAAAVLSAMSLMSADVVATPGVMMFIAASLSARDLPVTNNLLAGLNAAIRRWMANGEVGSRQHRCGSVCRRRVASPKYHRCRRQGSNALAAAGEPETLGGGGLDAHAGHVDLQDLGDA